MNTYSKFLVAIFILQFCFCSKKSSEDNTVSVGIINPIDMKFMHKIAENSGQWHNECMELGLNNLEIKNAPTIEEKKFLLRKLISEFCATKLGITKEEAMESIRRYEASDFKSSLIKYDVPRQEILMKMSNLYKESYSADEIIDGVEKLELECQDKGIYDPTMHTILNIAKNSVAYWHNKDKDSDTDIVIFANKDPLTKRQREVMNADAEGGATGGVTGLLTGGPWGGVVGAIGGAISGSLYHAIFK